MRSAMLGKGREEIKELVSKFIGSHYGRSRPQRHFIATPFLF
jgi:hypothetical protein